MCYCNRIHSGTDWQPVRNLHAVVKVRQSRPLFFIGVDFWQVNLELRLGVIGRRHPLNSIFATSYRACLLFMSTLCPGKRQNVLCNISYETRAILTKVSWINLLQNHVNIFHLAWIAGVLWKINYKKTFWSLFWTHCSNLNYKHHLLQTLINTCLI